MRRQDLAIAVKNIQEGLKKSDISKALDLLMRSDSDKKPPEALLSLQQWAIFINNCGPNEKIVVEIFDLDQLATPQMWQKLLYAKRTDMGPEFFRLAQMARYISTFLSKIVELIQPEAIRKLEARPNAVKDQLLSVIVLENQNQFSTPLRLSEMFMSITLIYDVIADLENINPNTLSVVACDSGSDKSFDFLGAAKAIAGLKEVLLGLWDRIFFFKKHGASLDIDLIAKGLPVLEKINQLETTGVISPEKAELLRRNIMNGCSKFIASGAIIADFEAQATLFEPRKLMTPEPKLLSAPTNDEAEEAGDSKTQAPKRKRRRKKPEDSDNIA